MADIGEDQHFAFCCFDGEAAFGIGAGGPGGPFDCDGDARQWLARLILDDPFDGAGEAGDARMGKQGDEEHQEQEFSHLHQFLVVNI
jgi:hypothetical protein